jgi:hypothetical protein
LTHWLLLLLLLLLVLVLVLVLLLLLLLPPCVFLSADNHSRALGLSSQHQPF